MLKPLRPGERSASPIVEYTLISIMMSIVFSAIAVGVGIGLFVTFIGLQLMIFIFS